MSADELMREINKLNSLLQDKLKIERATEEEEYQFLLKKVVGIDETWLRFGNVALPFDRALQLS